VKQLVTGREEIAEVARQHRSELQSMAAECIQAAWRKHSPSKPEQDMESPDDIMGITLTIARSGRLKKETLFFFLIIMF